MKEAIKKEEKTLTLIGKFLLWVPSLLLVIFLLFFALLQVPQIQTRLINTITQEISSKTNFKIKLDYANLTWYDKMLFEKIEVYDPQDSLMLKIPEAKLNIGLFAYLIDKKLAIDELLVSDLMLNILKSSDSVDVNISQFITELKDSFGKKSGKKTKLQIGKIILNNGYFTFNDDRKQIITEGKDYFHFGMKKIQTEVEDFVLFNDTINLKIASFEALDLSDQLNINSLQGNYMFCKQSMSLYDYTLKTDNSVLNDSISLYYENPSALKYFVDSVRFAVVFDDSYLSSEDVSLFANELRKFNERINVSGAFNGSIKRFQGKNVSLQMGNNSSIVGNMFFSGLPQIKETFIELNISQSKINPFDFVKFIPEDQQQKIINAGAVDFEGQFLGFLNDFVAKGNFNTNSGFVGSDVNFKVGSDNVAKYTGGLVLKNFDLGNILNDTETYQKIDLSGKIQGSGLDKKTADFFLIANIDSIGIKNYVYKDIQTNGEFSNQFFEGKLVVNDQNLKLNGFATIDLRNKSEKVNVKARIDTLLLEPLGFSNENIAVATSIDADLKGFHIDSIKGYVDLHKINVNWDAKELEVDSLKIISYLVEDQRILSLDTDGLNMEVKGDYNNSSIIESLSEIIGELKLKLINNSEDIIEYYEAKKKNPIDRYDLEFALKLWDVNKFIQPFYPTFSLSKNIIINGNFNSAEVTQLSLFTQIDTLRYDDQFYINNELDMEISKFAFNDKLLSSIYVNSENQVWNDKISTKNFYLESIWLDRHADVVVNLEQYSKSRNIENKANIRTSIDFLEDSINLNILNSRIEVLDKVWKVDQGNRVVYSNNSLNVENLTFEIEDQLVALNGKLSKKPEDKLKLELSHFGLNNINAALPINIFGSLDGFVELNYLDNDLLVESSLNANKFKIEEYLVGNIEIESFWENKNERLKLSVETLRGKDKIIDIDGYFYPKNINDQLDLSAKFENTNLLLAQPFLKSQFSQMSGMASGDFNISGKLSSPILRGNGKLEKGHILVNYLNTKYTFEGNLNFEENEIGVKNLILKDTEKDSAVFNGGVFHDGFRNFVLDLKGEFNNFKSLNTTSVDNNLYYGTIYATGDINFLGTIKNLQIKAKAKTNRNTKIFIPIGSISSNDLEEKEYISFIDLNDRESQVQLTNQEKDEINLKGIKLDFDIEVTNDAYTELIFDVAAGDIIRGRGNGNLNLQIDTNGDFNMFGDYQIESGGYNFTLYNIINKEFEIQKNSQISWYGDPYGAKLNIQAKYRQLASLAPLIIDSDPSLVESRELGKVYPSIVDLNISGNLLNPDIKFDIDVEDYPNSITLSDVNRNIQLQTIVSGFKTKLAQNEQEMKRQVFSLIILKKFSPENSFSVNSNTIGNSLSEFVSNQLSYWATQVDENLEIDVNLAGLDSDAFNTFQLRLSYTFLDGRLRVTRGGGFSSDENDAKTSSILGDWTVEYLLTQDGRFRAKMYSRTNLNATNGQLAGNNTETGFSLQFVRSFDELKRILIDNRDQNKKNKEASSELINEANLPEELKTKNDPIK